MVSNVKEAENVITAITNNLPLPLQMVIAPLLTQVTDEQRIEVASAIEEAAIAIKAGDWTALDAIIARFPGAADEVAAFMPFIRAAFGG